MARPRTGSLYKKSRVINGIRVESPYYTGAYTDPHTGQRVTRKLYSDKLASRRKLDQMIQAAEQKAAGIIDRYAEHRSRPIMEHIDDYLAHCKHVGMSYKTLHMKGSHLRALIEDVDAHRINDLEPNAISRWLQSLTQKGRSARTVNQNRADVVALMNWCVQVGRIPDNPLSVIPKLDERKDRRRVRRPLTEDELIYLLDIAAGQDEENGGRYTPRNLVYLTAALTGLRRSELKKMTWGDIDFQASVIRVRISVGKAKREDHIAMHPQVRDELASFKPDDASSADEVFATMPTIRTFYLDLERARTKWIGDAGDETEQQHRRNSDFLAKVDHQGRVVDLHAMRTTLGTMLAQQGVAPQLAQKIMRHSDYKTTLNHYTVLGLHDTARIIAGDQQAGRR